MSRKSRMQSAREAKDRRMKKIAIGGAVLLVAVLAFEVPKIMHSSSSSAASSTPSATTTTGAPVTSTGTPVSTAPGTAAAVLTPAASTKLPNSDVPPPRTKSQLYSFSHFTGKDPFAQQVDTAAPTAQTASASVPATSGGSGSSASSGGAQQKHVRTLAATGSARISVNGRIQTVRVGASFPSANPLFRLVAISSGVARIGIANGSYSSGAHTISLSAGRSLTLVDQADGGHYKIRLIAAS
jgi:perilipin-4